MEEKLSNKTSLMISANFLKMMIFPNSMVALHQEVSSAAMHKISKKPQIKVSKNWISIKKESLIIKEVLLIEMH